MNIPTQTYIDAANAATIEHERQFRDAVDDPGKQKHHERRVKSFNRVLAEAVGGNVPTRLNATTWLVHSRSNSGDAYRVDTTEHTCNCRAGLCGNACWHQDAAFVAESVERADAFDSEKQTTSVNGYDYTVDFDKMDVDAFAEWTKGEKVDALMDALDTMDAEKGKVVA